MSTSARTCAHDRGAADVPGPQVCKDCGARITWVGPGVKDYETADDAFLDEDTRSRLRDNILAMSARINVFGSNAWRRVGDTALVEVDHALVDLHDALAREAIRAGYVDVDGFPMPGELLTVRGEEYVVVASTYYAVRGEEYGGEEYVVVLQSVRAPFYRVAIIEPTSSLQDGVEHDATHYVSYFAEHENFIYAVRDFEQHGGDAFHPKEDT